MRKLVASIKTASVRPLVLQGASVHRSHVQLEAILKRRLSERHALLLAEPMGSADDPAIDWYSRAEGEARRIVDLPPAERETARAEFDRLRGEIAALAQELIGSPDSHHQTIGRTLELALRHPGDDFVYRVGDQPVLIGWGFMPASGPGDAETLTRRQVRAATPSPAAPVTAAPLSPPPPPRRSGAWWPSLLSFLLGMGLVLALLWGMRGCTPSEDPQLAVLMAEKDREAALRQKSIELLAELDAKRRTCRPPPPPAPAPTPSEFDRRLQEHGGQTGDVTITLIWFNHNDLDLHVYDPATAHIFYRDKSTPSGGRLDVDANANCKNTTARPVENVVWVKNAPRGSYQVDVVRIRCNEADKSRTPFNVRIKMGDRVREISGQVGFGERVTVGTFVNP